MHICGADHTSGHHDDDHHGAHHNHSGPVRQAQEWLDENSGADHLGDQIEEGYDECRKAGSGSDPTTVVFGSQCIGKRVLPKPFEWLCHNEKGHDPAGQITDGIKETIVSVKCNHAADAEETGCREIIASKCNPIDEPGDIAASCEETFGGLGFRTKIERQGQCQADNHGEDHNGLWIDSSIHREFS